MAPGKPARLTVESLHAASPPPGGIVTPAAMALAAILDHVPLDEAARARVGQRMAEPHRRYHGPTHLATLWSRHRAHAAASVMDGPELQPWIASAIAYHDAIYDPTRADNETRSAALWRDEAAGLPPARVAWVAGTIAATADHVAYRPAASDKWETARIWVLDLDLSPLGEPEEQFDHNTELLRAEYAHMDDESWRHARVAFLTRLAAAPCLYRTPVIAAAYADAARRNIERSLVRLRSG